jgi:hypothetical protein
MNFNNYKTFNEALSAHIKFMNGEIDENHFSGTKLQDFDNNEEFGKMLKYISNKIITIDSQEGIIELEWEKDVKNLASICEYNGDPITVDLKKIVYTINYQKPYVDSYIRIDDLVKIIDKIKDYSVYIFPCTKDKQKIKTLADIFAKFSDIKKYGEISFVKNKQNYDWVTEMILFDEKMTPLQKLPCTHIPYEGSNTELKFEDIVEISIVSNYFNDENFIKNMYSYF